jgi:hypothetical protein
MQKHSTRIVRKTVLGVNDETLGVIEIRLCFDAIENTIHCTKVKYYTENHTFKAGEIY